MKTGSRSRATHYTHERPRRKLSAIRVTTHRSPASVSPAEAVQTVGWVAVDTGDFCAQMIKYPLIHLNLPCGVVHHKLLRPDVLFKTACGAVETQLTSHGGAQMARIARIIGISTLGLALTGCVTQEKYNALKLDRDALSEQLAKAQGDANSARSAAEAYKAQLDNVNGQGGNMMALVTSLRDQNASLQSQYDDINRKYMDALNRPMGSSPLPIELSNTLQNFANQNPELVEFDAGRGIVKFKSDVTFASGDATVTPKAKDVLSKFATILNSSSAASYELLVAGHTDNMRVSNPNTIAKGHKDNWHLSAHRAISVAGELISQNVNSQRIGVLGYGEQRPVASNASETGRTQNRRVEVLILPNQVRSGTAVTNSGGSNPQRPLNKDQMTSTPTAPIINK